MAQIIEVNGIKYGVKKSIRSIMLFEDMTGKSISEMNATNYRDLLTYSYCVFKASNRQALGQNFDIDAFLDMCDDNEGFLEELMGAITKLVEEGSENDSKKKKKAKKSV
jgi:hypothetical protein